MSCSDGGRDGVPGGSEPRVPQYSQRDRMDRGGLSRREDREDPAEDRRVRVGCFPFSISVPPAPNDALVAKPPSPHLPWGCSPSGSPCPPPLRCVSQHPPSTHPAPTQHSPSAQERRSLQGCQAHPRTTNNNNNNMQIQKLGFSAPKWQQPDPAVGVGGWVSCSSSSAHLGTSRARLTLGTIQTTEALGGRGGGSASVPPTPHPPQLIGWVLGFHGGFPGLGVLSVRPTSHGGMQNSLCVPSCLADQQFQGDRVRPTRKGRGVTQSHGSPCPHPLCAVHAVGPPTMGGASPGGQGVHVHQDGRVCQLHPIDKDTVGGTAPQR